jgi:membrane peptidoglycan carboxypeptidase
VSRRGERSRAPRVRKAGYRRIIDYPRAGRRGWRAFLPSWRLVAGSFAGALLLMAGLVAVSYALAPTPDLDNLSLPTATVYEYSNGTVFYTAGLQDRVIVPIGQIPVMMRHAIISVENPTFETDAGIAPRSIVRAFVNDIEGHPTQGGSTITQQFVKNAYLTDNQTLTRKISEVFIAVKITTAYAKQKILDDYLNTVYFGRGSYGVDAAAQAYFGVSANRITDPGRAAYLAALVNEPAVLSQADPPSQALLRRRWNLVLDDMVKTGDLTHARREAVTWPAALRPGNGIVRDANGVNDSAMAQVANSYLDKLHARDPNVPDSATADAGGDVIVTTFNRAAMTNAVQAVNTALYGRLNRKNPRQAAVDKGAQAGLATVDARNGELLAFYPGRSDYNNATQAQIEPGSQMQTFALAARLPKPGPPGRGASSMWALMGRVGLTQNLKANPGELPEPLAKLRRDPQLALGIAPESPARMAAAFAVFQDNGIYHDLAAALSVTVNGHQVWAYAPHAIRVLSPVSATFTSRQLSPGETGTIGGDGSAWFTGYIGDVVTSVALWDESVNRKHQVVLRSLNQLGGVPAAQSSAWPLEVWAQYMKMRPGGQALARAPTQPYFPGAYGIPQSTFRQEQHQPDFAAGR